MIARLEMADGPPTPYTIGESFVGAVRHRASSVTDRMKDFSRGTIQFVRWVLNRVRSSMSLDNRGAPRLQRDLYPEYLRLLDARDDDASVSTIAKVIYGGQAAADELVRKRLKAATALCEGGYRDLLLWGDVHIPDNVPPFPHELDDLAVELWMPSRSLVAIVAACLLLAITGAGRYSVDHRRVLVPV